MNSYLKDLKDMYQVVKCLNLLIQATNRQYQWGLVLASDQQTTIIIDPDIWIVTKLQCIKKAEALKHLVHLPFSTEIHVSTAAWTVVYTC